MPVHTDQTGRAVAVGRQPHRIVSLVPSLTELLCDLGLKDQLVGITKFCVHPTEVYRSRTRVGGTKDFRQDLVEGLAPDFVLANKEENPKSRVLALAERFPTWVTDVHDVATALEMIEGIGQVLQVEEAATSMVRDIRLGMAGLKKVSGEGSPPTALYLIWKNPYMAAGTDTFISAMMQKIGLKNVLEYLGDRGLRYPRLDASEMEALRPDFILLSSEPYPFKASDVMETEALAHRKALLVDGEAFSWYGSRMLKSISILNGAAGLMNAAGKTEK